MKYRYIWLVFTILVITGCLKSGSGIQDTNNTVIRNSEEDNKLAKPVPTVLPAAVYSTRIDNICQNCSVPDSEWEEDGIPGEIFIRYSADKAFDKNIRTAWMFDTSKAETKLNMTFEDEILIDSIEIIPGARVKGEYSDNSRLKDLTVRTESGKFCELNFTDDLETRRVHLDKPVLLDTMSFTVDEIYKGNLYSVVSISEINLYYTGTRIDILYPERITFENGNYILPAFTYVSMFFGNSATLFELHYDNTVSGAHDEGSQLMKEIKGGSWQFDSAKALFYLEYEYEDVDGLTMGVEDFSGWPVVDGSATLKLVSSHVFVYSDVQESSLDVQYDFTLQEKK